MAVETTSTYMYMYIHFLTKIGMTIESIKVIVRQTLSGIYLGIRASRAIARCSTVHVLHLHI